MSKGRGWGGLGRGEDTVGVATASGGSRVGTGLRPDSHSLAKPQAGQCWGGKGAGTALRVRGPHPNSPLLLPSMSSGFQTASLLPPRDKEKSREPTIRVRRWRCLGQACMTGVQGEGPGVRGGGGVVPALCHLPWNAAPGSVLDAVGPYCEP